MNATVRGWLRWTASFLAFPVGGVAGGLVAGPVDAPLAALTGGLVTGAVIGLGQALLSSRRVPVVRWTVATALGLGLGLLLGAGVVDYATSGPQLALMGAVTGLVLGAAQVVVLPVPGPRRWLWLLAVPALWAAGWAVTTVAGIDVGRHFTVFGASGALTVSALAGALLAVLLPAPAVPARRAAPSAAGDRS
jgi:hypothetical protein